MGRKKGSGPSITEYRIKQKNLNILLPSLKPFVSEKNIKKLVDSVNKRQYELAVGIGELVKDLLLNSRKNDLYILSHLQKKLNNIVRTTTGSITNKDLNLSKKEILLKIKNLNTLTLGLKLKIEKYIESQFDGCGRDDIEREFSRDINTLINVLKNKKYIYDLDKNETIKLYKNLLNNEHFTRRLSRSMSLYVSHITINDTKLFKSLVLSFRRKHHEIFGTPSSSGMNMSLGLIITKGGMANIFLIKYNAIVLRLLKRKALNLRAKDMDQVRKNILSSRFKDNIIKELKKWWKIKTQFRRMFTDRFWKRKFSNLKENIILGWKNTSKSGLFLDITANTILFTGKFLFKTALFGAKIGMNILGRIYNIGSKIISGTITILKNILGVAFKIMKTVLGTPYDILKRLMMFIMTPFGAYTVGFIIGFLKMKALLTYKKLRKKAVKILKWFKTKDKKYSVLTETEEVDVLDENGEKTGLKMYIPKKNLYTKIKDNIINIFKFFGEIYGILTDEQGNKLDRLKLSFDGGEGDKDGNRNYSDTIISIENTIIDLIGLGDNKQFFDKYIGWFKDVVHFVLTNPLIYTFKTMTQLTGTGIPSHAAGVLITNQVAKLAINLVGTVISAGVSIYFGPLAGAGAAVLSGAISAIALRMLSNHFLMKTPKQSESVLMGKVFFVIDNRHRLGILSIRNNRLKRIQYLKCEINKLRESLRTEKDELKRTQSLKYIEKYFFELNSLKNQQRLESSNLVVNAIENQTGDIILGNSVDDLIEQVINGGKQTNLRNKSFDFKKLISDIENVSFISDIENVSFIYDKKDSYLYNKNIILKTMLDLYEKKIDVTKFFIAKYAFKYASGGYGYTGKKETIDKYKNEVKENIEKIFGQKFIGDITYNKLLELKTAKDAANLFVSGLLKGIEIYSSLYKLSYPRAPEKESHNVSRFLEKTLYNFLNALGLEYLNITDFNTKRLYRLLKWINTKTKDDSKTYELIMNNFDLFTNLPYIDNDNLLSAEYDRLLISLQPKTLLSSKSNESDKSLNTEHSNGLKSTFQQVLGKINRLILPSTADKLKLEELYKKFENKDLSEDEYGKYIELHTKMEESISSYNDIDSLYKDVLSIHTLVVNPIRLYMKEREPDWKSTILSYSDIIIGDTTRSYLLWLQLSHK